jgi:hypothetical protein
MTTSPTLTLHYLAEPAPRQHAFPHSPNTSEEEMEEKEYVNQNLHILSNSEQCLFSGGSLLLTERGAVGESSRGVVLENRKLTRLEVFTR